MRPTPIGPIVLVASAMYAAVLLGGDVIFAPAGADQQVARQLVNMFTSGYDRRADSLKDAHRYYDLARNESKGDPKVEYAYGLVLLKQMKNKDAIVQFQTAINAPGSQFWPAWQALIWSHFVAKDYSTGYERLNEFARRLAAIKGPTGLADRQQSAEWIGEVIAALQKSADTVKQRAALLQEEETLKEILGAGLQGSFTGGKSSVHTLHSMMEDDVQQTRELIQSKQDKDRVEKQVQYDKDLEASKERREAIKKTNEEWKKYLEEELAGYNKQLTRLERDYDFLQRRVLSVTASQLQLNSEMSLLDQQVSNLSQNRQTYQTQTLGQAYQQRQNVLGVQLLAYQMQLDQSLAATLVVSQKAQTLVGQRTATVQRYERATGQLVEQDTALNKWEDRLKKDGEKLKVPAAAKSKTLDNKVQQARSFRTYVDLDLVLERDRLLDTFGVSIPETPESAK